MKDKILLSSYNILLILNIIFWTILARVFSNGHFIIKLLMGLEPILFGTAWIGFIFRNRVIYVFSVFFFVSNSVLSLTDETGVLDIMSFILSFSTFVNALFVRKHVFQSKTPLKQEVL